MVPNEAQLAAELGVSQGTVRKALDLLEAEKIVTRCQGKGTFVIDQDTQSMAVRFSSIVDRHGHRIDGQVFTHTSAFGTPDSEVLAHIDATESDEIFCQTRTHSYCGKTLMWEQTTIVLRHWPNFNKNDPAYERITTLAQKNGVLLSHAVEKVKPAVASEEIAERLNVPANTPILGIDRVVHSDRGVRLEWRRAFTALPDVEYISVTS